MLVVMSQRTAFGGMLQKVIEPQAIVFRSEQLDAIVEQRCKRVKGLLKSQLGTTDLHEANAAHVAALRVSSAR